MFAMAKIGQQIKRAEAEKTGNGNKYRAPKVTSDKIFSINVRQHRQKSNSSYGSVPRSISAKRTTITAENLIQQKSHFKKRSNVTQEDHE
jgi:hypothetical protein